MDLLPSLSQTQLIELQTFRRVFDLDLIHPPPVKPGLSLRASRPPEQTASSFSLTLFQFGSSSESCCKLGVLLSEGLKLIRTFPFLLTSLSLVYLL